MNFNCVGIVALTFVFCSVSWAMDKESGFCGGAPKTLPCSPQIASMSSHQILPSHQFSQITYWKSERLDFYLSTDLCPPNKKQAIYDLLCDASVNPHFFAHGPLHPDSIKRFLDNTFRNNRKNTQNELSLPTLLLWDVCRKENNQLVGVIAVEAITKDHPHSIPTEGERGRHYLQDIQNANYVCLAYAVAPQHRQNGYASEMTLALMETLFEYTSINVMVHTCHLDNIPSSQSAITCGFLNKGEIYYNGKPGTFRIMRKPS